MKAWQFVGVDRPLALNDIPEPQPSPGEVIVDVAAAGMCHSDVGVMQVANFVPLPMPVPVTLGHEIAGTVSAVGASAGPWQVGDRVAVALAADRADPSKNDPLGFTRDGGYQAKVKVRQDDLVRIPDGVSFEHAAIATDAGVTAYLGVAVAGAVTRGTRVGIIGFGGLGQLGAQMAVALGAEVYVAEIKQAVWPDARRIGAVRVVADISELADVGLDTVVDFAGFGTTTAGAVLAVRPGGRVAQIGLGLQEATIDVWALVQKNVTLVGALGGTREHLERVLALFATGTLDPTLARIGFDEIPAALDRLARGETEGRTVVILA